MPRLSPFLLRHARHQDPLLVPLLRPCQDLESACNELRWLREHALKTVNASSTASAWRYRLHKLCLERSKGKPLQYILGTQPFGDLEILCKPGVLIPRPETESITTHLASNLGSDFAQKLSQRSEGIEDIQQIAKHRPLRILDLCTGTGCIPLLVHSLLSPKIPNLQIAGVDISPIAVKLAKENVKHNIKSGSLQASANEEISFHLGDIFSAYSSLAWADHTHWDVVTANPPYISPQAFNKTTSRSVRNYEPKKALVPPCQHPGKAIEELTSDVAIGDLFYPKLLHIAQQVHAKVLLMEVSDMAQAMRVVKMVLGTAHWQGCEIWRDWAAARKEDMESMKEAVTIEGKEVMVVGEGNGRSVLAWRDGSDKILRLSEN